jgi:hypothetical protein
MPPITAQINLASSLNQSLYTEHPDPTTLQAGTEMDALTRGTMPRQETSCRDKKRRGNTETAGGVSIPPIPPGIPNLGVGGPSSRMAKVFTRHNSGIGGRDYLL